MCVTSGSFSLTSLISVAAIVDSLVSVAAIVGLLVSVALFVASWVSGLGRDAGTQHCQAYDKQGNSSVLMKDCLAHEYTSHCIREEIKRALGNTTIQSTIP